MDLEAIVDSPPLSWLRNGFRTMRNSFSRIPLVGASLVGLLGERTLTFFEDFNRIYMGLNEGVTDNAPLIGGMLAFFYAYMKLSDQNRINNLGISLHNHSLEHKSYYADSLSEYAKAMGDGILQSILGLPLTLFSLGIYAKTKYLENNTEKIVDRCESANLSLNEYFFKEDLTLPLIFGFVYCMTKGAAYLWHSRNNYKKIIINDVEEYENSGLWNQAIDLIKSFPEDYVKSELSFELARLYFKKGDLDNCLFSLRDNLHFGFNHAKYVPKIFETNVKRNRVLSAHKSFVRDGEASFLAIANWAITAQKFGNEELAYSTWLKLEKIDKKNIGYTLLAADAIRLMGMEDKSDDLYTKFLDRFFDDPKIASKVRYFGDHKVSYLDFGDFIGRSVVLRESTKKTSLEKHRDLLKVHKDSTNIDEETDFDLELNNHEVKLRAEYRTIHPIKLEKRNRKHNLLLKHAGGHNLSGVLHDPANRPYHYAASRFLARELALIPPSTAKKKRPGINKYMDELLDNQCLKEWKERIIEILPHLVHDYRKYPNVFSRDGHTENYSVEILNDAIKFARFWAFDIDDRGTCKPQREAAKMFYRGHHYENTKDEFIQREKDITDHFIDPFNKLKEAKILEEGKFHESVLRENCLAALSLYVSDNKDDKKTALTWMQDISETIPWGTKRYKKYMTPESQQALSTMKNIFTEIVSKAA